jgi:hypothetical protein
MCLPVCACLPVCVYVPTHKSHVLKGSRLERGLTCPRGAFVEWLRRMTAPFEEQASALGGRSVLGRLFPRARVDV